VLFTYGKATHPNKPNAEVGMALHAASGSVHSSANTGATRLTASAALDVSSSKTQVLVASPTQVMLAAAGAAIQIDSGSITINAPGAVAFKAGMKNLTGGAAVSGPSLALPAASLVMPDKFSARMDLYDYFVQHRFKDVRYSARLTDGRFVSGSLDAHGRSRQVYASEMQEMELLVGGSKSEWDFIVDYDDINTP
jgi:type VI secretion system secreted protein VgrG